MCLRNLKPINCEGRGDKGIELTDVLTDACLFLSSCALAFEMHASDGVLGVLLRRGRFFPNLFLLPAKHVCKLVFILKCSLFVCNRRRSYMQLLFAINPVALFQLGFQVAKQLAAK